MYRNLLMQIDSKIRNFLLTGSTTPPNDLNMRLQGEDQLINELRKDQG